MPAIPRYWDLDPAATVAECELWLTSRIEANYPCIDFDEPVNNYPPSPGGAPGRSWSLAPTGRPYVTMINGWFVPDGALSHFNSIHWQKMPAGSVYYFAMCFKAWADVHFSLIYHPDVILYWRQKPQVEFNENTSIPGAPWKVRARFLIDSMSSAIRASVRTAAREAMSRV